MGQADARHYSQLCFVGVHPDAVAGRTVGALVWRENAFGVGHFRQRYRFVFGTVVGARGKFIITF